MKRPFFALFAVAAGLVIAGNAGAAGAVTKRLAIAHAQRGCHVWSTATTRTPTLSLSLRAGDQLTVVNHDLDMHKVVRVAGPWVNTGPFMMTNQHVTLRFAKVGLYRFHTRVADMRGMPDVETIGPDNRLVLTVRVR